MTCRVHYINAEGRPAWKDVTATCEDAEAVFRHLYPGVRHIKSVQIPGGVRAKKSSAASTDQSGPTTVLCDLSVEDQARRTAQWRELREKLGRIGTEDAAEASVVTCPECGGPAVLSWGRRSGNYIRGLDCLHLRRVQPAA